MKTAVEEFAKARDELIDAIYKALHIPQIVEWLASELNKTKQ